MRYFGLRDVVEHVLWRCVRAVRYRLRHTALIQVLPYLCRCLRPAYWHLVRRCRPNTCFLSGCELHLDLQLFSFLGRQRLYGGLNVCAAFFSGGICQTWTALNTLLVRVALRSCCMRRLLVVSD